MELRQLRYFVAVAEEGNISRAAKKIFLTQPALSRQIKALEEEIGQCLLERQAHAIRLTAAGQTLVREARALLEQADHALARVRAAGREVRLRVGYAPSLATGILSVALDQFAQKHRHACVELYDLSTHEMLARLEGETLDLAITVAQQKPSRGLTWIPLIHAAWELAVSVKNPLAHQSKVTPAEVARESLLVFSQRDYPEYWEFLARWFRANRVRPSIAGEYDGIESLLAAVESGLGGALVTTRTGSRLPTHVRLIKLSPAPEPLCIAAGYFADRGDAKLVGVFVEELRRAAAALA